MSKPDWTEAPDDATHWDTVRDFFCSYAGYWYKGVLFDVNYHIDWNTDRYTPRPVEPATTTWDGTGLPPVQLQRRKPSDCTVTFARSEY